MRAGAPWTIGITGLVPYGITMKQIGMVTSSRMWDYRVIANDPMEDDRDGSLRRIAEGDPPGNARVIFYTDIR